MGEEDTPSRRWRPVTALTPTADDVLPWVRTLVLAAGVLALLTLLFGLEAIGRV